MKMICEIGRIMCSIQVLSSFQIGPTYKKMREKIYVDVISRSSCAMMHGSLMWIKLTKFHDTFAIYI